MSILIAWVAFPLALGAVGGGLGLLVERLTASQIAGPLVVPLGLAAAIVIAALLTAWSTSAPIAVPVVGAAAAVGLWIGSRRTRLGRWPVLAAVAILLAYGAPVLLSGQATFAGYIRLDDTATWLGIVDRVMGHGRSLTGLVPSTYQLNLNAYVGTGYPIGSFMLLGIGRALVGVDAAWAFQPSLACCAAAIGLCAFELTQPIVASPQLRALVAFLAAQPALLYGYSLWGGVKELVSAFLLALLVALGVAAARRRPKGVGEPVPLAIAAAALAVTLGQGAVVWIAPVFVVVIATWALRERAAAALGATAAYGTWLVAATAALSVPMLFVLGSFASSSGALYSSSSNAPSLNLGNLYHPLSALQLAGIWPVGDFRFTADGVPSVALISLLIFIAGVALVRSALQRQGGLALYVAVALVGCAGIKLAGATPWVLAKSYAIASPALLTAALAGAAALFAQRRMTLPVLVALAGGVLWGNVLAYHDVLLAPRPRLAELQRIGPLVAGAGPTLINEYEIYGDRHFLRAGDPQAPAEYRPSLIRLTDNALLTKSAWADLDAFPISSLYPFRSLVVRRSPVASRPPSIYSLRYSGRYYQLYERPAHPTVQIVGEIPLGDSSVLPYCGQSTAGPNRPLCPIAPAATPPCSEIRSIAHLASTYRARLVAYQRPLPIVLRGDQTSWPRSWPYNPVTGTLTPNSPGRVTAWVNLPSAQRYALWLGGSFARGFDVTIDGRYLGRVHDELSTIGQYERVAEVSLAAGRHTVTLEYPHSDLAPGSGDNSMTSLSEIAFEPLQTPVAEMLNLAPQQAQQLCGRPLDWIELVVRAPHS